jgi:hypothetical protein
VLSPRFPFFDGAHHGPVPDAVLASDRVIAGLPLSISGSAHAVADRGLGFGRVDFSEAPSALRLTPFERDLAEAGRLAGRFQCGMSSECELAAAVCKPRLASVGFRAA